MCNKKNKEKESCSLFVANTVKPFCGSSIFNTSNRLSQLDILLCVVYVLTVMFVILLAPNHLSLSFETTR